jgi:diguanylate cyclase (GGDEF)-like protein
VRLGRFGNPLSWSEVDRCLLVVAIMLPGVAFFSTGRQYLDLWSYLPPYADPEVVRSIDSLSLLAAVAWVGLLVAGVALRRRYPRSRPFVYTTVLVYGLTIALFVYLAGPFYSPGWIFFLGGAIVGLLLFGGRVTIFGIGAFLAALAGALCAGHLGWLGQLPGVTRPPGVSAEDWTWWSLRMGLSSAVFTSFTLALCAYIISQLRRREAQLLELARTDALTGLTNRRHFMRVLARELQRARRYQLPLACVMLDLDDFKGINDRHGHLVGDEVLVAVAGALRAAVRETDVVARYGGEEFAVLLPSTSLEGAGDVAERCRALIEGITLPAEDGPVRITTSMGVASYPDTEAADVDDLLRAADQALYAAKRRGKNRVETVS